MKMVIVIRTDLKMSRGKEIGQGAHGVIKSYLMAAPIDGWLWFQRGQKKIVVSVDSEEALLKLAAAASLVCLPHYLVRDFGQTEVPARTPTALAIGPAEENRIHRLTGRLKLHR